MAEQIQSDQQIVSREFRVNGINLISGDGVSVDIGALVMEIILKQDIFANFMNGSMMVVDGANLIHERKAHGNEYVLLDLYEPGGLSVRKAFRIYKISDRESTTSNAQRYTIHFVSDEMVHSNFKRVSKAYKKTTISKIVQDILINYMGINNYRIENTSSQVDVVIPSWRPIEAINWLSRRAEKGENQFCYMFYENLDGFHFKSLHTIYKSQPLNSTEYVYEPKAAQPDMQLNKTTIDHYKAKDFDVLTAHSRGATSMRFIGVDPVHRTVTDNKISLAQIPSIHDRQLPDNVVDPGTDEMFYEQYDALRLVHLQTEPTATEQGNHSDVWIRHIQSLAMMQHNSYTLTMPGNLQIQVGKLVKVIFPNFDTPIQVGDGNRPTDPYYLITGVSHVFNVPMGTFDTTFAVTRDSIPNAIVTDKSLPTKVRDLNEK